MRVHVLWRHQVVVTHTLAISMHALGASQPEPLLEFPPSLPRWLDWMNVFVNIQLVTCMLFYKCTDYQLALLRGKLYTTRDVIPFHTMSKLYSTENYRSCFWIFWVVERVVEVRTISILVDIEEDLTRTWFVSRVLSLEWRARVSWLLRDSKMLRTEELPLVHLTRNCVFNSYSLPILQRFREQFLSFLTFWAFR